MRRAACAALLLCMICAPSPRAHADAVITLDLSGPGFDDTTPVAPVGGNPGTTLGEQRANALRFAADMWGAALDSDVPIEILVEFVDLGCAADGAPLAQAGPEHVLNGITTEGADPTLWYPAALANRLAQEDLFPGEPEIAGEFNSAVDSPNCFSGSWYYGFDRNNGAQTDLISTALHEFGHGLGFLSFDDPATGAQFVPGEADPYSALLWDRSTDKAWQSLTDVERAASSLIPRNIAWTGALTNAAALQVLQPGSPSIALDPPVAAFSGFAADTGYSTIHSTEAGMIEIGVPFDGCEAPQFASLTGKVALYEPLCTYDIVAANAEAAGAVGVLLIIPSSLDSPASPLPAGTLTTTIPVLTLSKADGTALEDALSGGAIEATLTLDAAQLRGADDEGRVLLFTSQPVLTGSAVSHFDILARPDLIMEPFDTGAAIRDLDLTLPLMIDLGWTPFCGNGRLDQDEQCDDADDNDDTLPNACRTDCTDAHCGDAVIDDQEACDDGDDNSDAQADACRTDCTEARCGDAVVDEGEACDDGDDNSDDRADACRSDCTAPRCGDSVVDEGEDCDGSQDCDAQCELPPPPVVSPDADAGGTAGNSATTNGDADAAKSSSDDGCGCRIAGASPGSSVADWLAWLGFVALAATLRTRARVRRRIAAPHQ